MAMSESPAQLVDIVSRCTARAAVQTDWKQLASLREKVRPRGHGGSLLPSTEGGPIVDTLIFDFENEWQGEAARCMRSPASFVEDPAEGLGIEVDRDGRQLVVAGVRADDGALDSHKERA